MGPVSLSSSRDDRWEARACTSYASTLVRGYGGSIFKGLSARCQSWLSIHHSSIYETPFLVFAAPSRVSKIATGEGIAGTRAAPTQSGNNDTSIGGRLDHGETYEKDGKRYKRYNSR
ncbi:hypothetical protein CIHG_05845 [Coccidioides immitis H538.4]|uniref:Uncharacterized protein n=2 Tax=Coccidioides immitis TaxID=5501 RepID=A0A0J8RTF7_COCIT|nr:hypothetical protein CIRG_01910 [Coccidioides immitis RMSCC 2394]KMU88077.1 hypothetical protein CIHG_05845 [Coccidioides immitis H538.4]